MDNDTPRFVLKVHPATREVEPDDPMTLLASPVAGDPDTMIRALTWEYLGMGWDMEQILRLFRDPCYPMLHGLWQSLGEAELQNRIEAARRLQGSYQFRTTVWEAPEEPEPQLVQIGPMGPEGDRHADRL